MMMTMNGDTVPSILNYDARWSSVVTFTACLVYIVEGLFEPATFQLIRISKDKLFSNKNNFKKVIPVLN
jgi:ubiquitin-protein ligase